jgi:aminopeptidase
VIDPRLEKLAKILVDYSVAVKPGENVLVQDTGIEPDFDKALVKAIHEAGGRAFVTLRDKALDRALLKGAPAEQLEMQARFELDRMKQMDCYIGYNAWRNLSSWSDLSGDELDLYNKNIWKKVHIEARLPGTRWVVLRYPSAAMAQMAAMSEEAFEDFFFDVCTMDYARMSKAMDPLVEYLSKADKVRAPTCRSRSRACLR